MNKGQSLFELVVAIAISALIIVAIVSLVTNSIRNSTFSKNQSLASTYAQQATEWLRGQRDANFDSFLATATPPTDTWCLKDQDLPANLTNIETQPCSVNDIISGTPFTRQVSFIITNPLSSSGSPVTVIEADVTVGWSDSQGLHKVTSATSFSDWRQR